MPDGQDMDRSALGRMTGAGQGREAAIERIVRRAARDGAGLAAVLDDSSLRDVSVADAMAGLEPADLALLAGGDPGALVLVSEACVTAIVERATLGAVGAGELSGRRPTATDAALVKPLLAAIADEAALLGGFDRAISGLTRLAGVCRVIGAEEADLSLPPGPSKALRLSLGLGDGAREGWIEIILPTALQPKSPPRDWTDKLDRALRPARQPFDVVLAKTALSVGRLSSLAPGDCLPLPDAALDRVTLVDRGGRALTTARLGKVGGNRAIRITTRSPLAAFETSGGAGAKSDGEPANPSQGMSTKDLPTGVAVSEDRSDPAATKADVTDTSSETPDNSEKLFAELASDGPRAAAGDTGAAA